MRRWRLRLVALTMMALGAVPLLGSSASAAPPDAAGWWSDTSTPLGVNPAAPTAGEDQLVVQGEPSGANAIAALRWTLAEGESSPTLTLKAADGSVVPAEALILACKAGTPWTEAKGAPMAEAPKVDCATSVNGVVADDGTITFALGALLNGTTLDVVLTPGKTPEDQGSSFSLIFDRPGPDALTTSAGGADSGSSFDPSTAPSGDSFTAPSTSGSGAGSGSFSTPSSGGGSFSAPSTGGTPAAEPALPDENQVAMDTGTGAGAQAQAQPASSSDRDRAKTLGIVVLLAGAAVAAWSFMASNPARTGAGAVPAPVVAGEPVAGGLGRFVRPRTGAPPSLS